ncbi:hypothetical protein C0J52_27980 [Blattella germanica]|nr:hypothetical protein C0J52_27980 [Blattella germanica]
MLRSSPVIPIRHIWKKHNRQKAKNQSQKENCYAKWRQKPNRGCQLKPQRTLNDCISKGFTPRRTKFGCLFETYGKQLQQRITCRRPACYAMQDSKLSNRNFSCCSDSLENSTLVVFRNEKRAARKVYNCLFCLEVSVNTENNLLPMYLIKISPFHT